jgi:hypothetical protein
VPASVWSAAGPVTDTVGAWLSTTTETGEVDASFSHPSRAMTVTSWSPSAAPVVSHVPS